MTHAKVIIMGRWDNDSNWKTFKVQTETHSQLSYQVIIFINAGVIVLEQKMRCTMIDSVAILLNQLICTDEIRTSKAISIRAIGSDCYSRV